MTDHAPHIGTLNEGSLHAALKSHYEQPGDRFEVPLRGFVIDIVRDAGTPDELLIEVQTGSFAAMGNKLDHLLGEHRILIVHPVRVTTRLRNPDGSSRRSPKKGSVRRILDELVSIPTLLDHPNLSLDVVLVDVTKVRAADPRARRGRGGFRTIDTHLERIIRTHHLAETGDLLQLVPAGLPSPFTTTDLATAGPMSRGDAQKLAYCCHAAGLFDRVERTKAGYHYLRTCQTFV